MNTDIYRWFVVTVELKFCNCGTVSLTDTPYKKSVEFIVYGSFVSHAFNGSPANDQFV